MVDREELEMVALQEVCACRYYDLTDTINETPDGDLMTLIEHTNPCEICQR